MKRITVTFVFLAMVVFSCPVWAGEDTLINFASRQFGVSPQEVALQIQVGLRQAQATVLPKGTVLTVLGRDGNLKVGPLKFDLPCKLFRNGQMGVIYARGEYGFITFPTNREVAKPYVDAGYNQRADSEPQVLIASADDAEMMTRPSEEAAQKAVTKAEKTQRDIESYKHQRTKKIVSGIGGISAINAGIWLPPPWNWAVSAALATGTIIYNMIDDDPPQLPAEE